MHQPTRPSPDTAADPRWAAVLAREAAADGRFVYAVTTTGIYCRPSCPARRPRPANVRFFATADAAERAGYRACRRCRPAQPPGQSAHAAAVTAACRRIESAEHAPGLAELAADAGLSPHHFQRVFKRATGLTPRQYAAALRQRRVRAALARGASVTEALHAAGYGSSGRFYEQADAALGMTPGDYRAGGHAQTIRFAVGACALGEVLVAESARGVCAIYLGDEPAALVDALQTRFPRAELIGGDAAFEARVAQIVGLVERPGPAPELPLDIRGTAFQQRVWQALRAVPAGETVTYAELARRIGAPRSARAVAGACAANELAVAIPCHRVVRSDGGLSGYRWGVARKRALIERESGG